jgi:hypothetical protein
MPRRPALIYEAPNIRELICQCTLPIVRFSHFMQTTTLTTVDVHLLRSSRYSQAEQNAIETAFRSSHSLESLRIHTDDPVVATLVLNGLKDGATNEQYKLRELKLKCFETNDRTWPSLSEFARTTTHLQHLQLEHSELYEFDMPDFLTCLAAPSSFSKLSLLEFCMYEDILSPFVQFMQQPKDLVAGAAPLAAFVIDWEDHAEELSGSSFASMFFRRQDDDTGEWYSTIGSSLHSLSVSSIQLGCYDFLQAMAQNAHLLELKCLKLSGLDDLRCKDLAALVSKRSSLETIELSDISDARPILFSLRRNGTLRTILILGEKESRLANSYCLRNTHIGRLLESFVVAELGNGDIEQPKPECGSMHLYPTLLQVSKQIACIRSATIMSSLLSLRGSIGPLKD